MKIVEIYINNCSDCPFVDFDNQEEVYKFGKYWCEPLDTEVQHSSIHEDCPLDDTVK